MSGVLRSVPVAEWGDTWNGGLNQLPVLREEVRRESRKAGEILAGPREVFCDSLTDGICRDCDYDRYGGRQFTQRLQRGASRNQNDIGLGIQHLLSGRQRTFSIW